MFPVAKICRIIQLRKFGKLFWGFYFVLCSFNNIIVTSFITHKTERHLFLITPADIQPIDVPTPKPHIGF